MLPFWRIWSTIGMFFFLFGFILSKVKSIAALTKAQKSLFIGFTGILLAFLFAAIFSKEEKNWFELQKRVALLIIPLSILFNKKWLTNSSYFKFSLKSYIAGILILNTITLIKTLLFYINHGNLPFSNGPDIFEILIIDRPYYGLFNSIAVAIVLFLYQSKLLNRNSSYLIALYSIFMVNLITARAAMGIILIIVIIHLIFQYKKEHLSKVIGFSVLVSLFMGILFYYNPNLQERFKNMSSYEPRTLIWPAFYDIINQEKFDWFLGSKSEIEGQKLLNKEYKKEYENNTVWKWVYEEKFYYNTHNQFFGMYLAFGSIGLLCYLIPFLVCFYEALNTRNFFLLVITFIFFTTSLVENITARQIGVYSLTMFLSIATISSTALPKLLGNNNE